MPACPLVNAAVHDYAPQILARARSRSDEIVAHGRTNSERQGDLDEAAEGALIAEATATITAHEGSAPEGWLGPWISETCVTPDLLKEAGYAYVMDWPLEDQPVRHTKRAACGLDRCFAPGQRPPITKSPLAVLPSARRSPPGPREPYPGRGGPRLGEPR